MSDDPVILTCGCAASSLRTLTDGSAVSACFLHDCIEVDKNPPDLTGRMASCMYDGSCRNRRGGPNAYMGRRTRPDHGAFDAKGHSVAPSSRQLPLFRNVRDQSMDCYYCGCDGWN